MKQNQTPKRVSLEKYSPVLTVAMMTILVTTVHGQVMMTILVKVIHGQVMMAILVTTIHGQVTMTILVTITHRQVDVDAWIHRNNTQQNSIMIAN